MSETNYCARHQDKETNLRCGRCDELICPKCMVHAAVGIRCPDCAKVQRIPTFDVSGAYLARAIAAGLALGIGGGAAAGLVVVLFFGLPYLGPFMIVGIGYLVAEGISVAVNRKRGRSLKYVSAGSVVIAVLTISIFSIGPMTLLDLLAGGYATYVAVKRF